MIVTFVGHGELSVGEDLEKKVREALLELLPSGERISFYCGGYGAFDDLCAKVCRSLKSEFPRSEVLYVTPYLSESHGKKIQRYMEAKLYDSVVYPPLESVPPRFAISRRNEWMVEQADLIVAFVCRPFGGAAGTLDFARRKKKRIVNLAFPEKA